MGKKKKKKQLPTGLLIGGVAVGTLLLVGGIVVAFMLGGRSKKEAVETNPEKGGPWQVVVLKEERRKVGAIVRRMQVPEILNLFKQLGLVYQERLTFSNKGPSGLKELGPDLANSKLKEWLSNGWIEVVWGAKLSNLPNGTSGTALAWETESDVTGRRIVLMCDGSVHELDESAFTNTAKAVGQ